MKFKLAATFLLLVCFVLNVSAQIEKGSILLGGEINFANYSTQYTIGGNFDHSVTYNRYAVSIGKAFKENVVYGVNISFSDYSTEYNTTNGINFSKFRTSGLGVFYRPYKSLSKDFFFFVEGGLAYSFSTQNDHDVNNLYAFQINRTGLNAYLSAGVAYNVFKKLQIEISLPRFLDVGFFHNVNKDATQTQISNGFSVQSSVGSNFINNLNVGFKLKL